eukprot:356225-Chlamydomonas_euryale.AAC.11
MQAHVVVRMATWERESVGAGHWRIAASVAFIIAPAVFLAIVCVGGQVQQLWQRAFLFCNTRCNWRDVAWLLLGLWAVFAAAAAVAVTVRLFHFAPADSTVAAHALNLSCRRRPQLADAHNARARPQCLIQLHERPTPEHHRHKR